VSCLDSKRNESGGACGGLQRREAGREKTNPGFSQRKNNSAGRGTARLESDHKKNRNFPGPRKRKMCRPR